MGNSKNARLTAVAQVKRGNKGRNVLTKDLGILSEVSVNIKGVDTTMLTVEDIRESKDTEVLLHEYVLHKSKGRLYNAIGEYELATVHNQMAVICENRLKVLAGKR